MFLLMGFVFGPGLLGGAAAVQPLLSIVREEELGFGCPTTMNKFVICPKRSAMRGEGTLDN
jgi:hypothetical protein